MKLSVLTIGKLKRAEYAGLAADYAGRIAHYLPFSHVIAKDEAKAMAAIDSDTFLVVMDEHGATKSSTELSQMLVQHIQNGTRKLVFFIGDARGVTEAMKKRANQIMSLSPMTFPHEMAAMIVLEQLYRACTIMKGEKYHYE